MKTKRLFIFEGPDCVGKTTAANALAKAIDAPIAHLTCTKTLAPAMLDYQMNALENVKTNMDLHDRSYVLDRHWPSELCYGSHFRGVTKGHLLPIINAANRLKPVFIFCMDRNGVESAVERHRKHIDKDHPYSDEDYRAVYKNYENLIARMDVDYPRATGHHIVKYFDESKNWKQQLESFTSDIREGFLA